MKPRILFLGHTSKEYNGHAIKIDRSDLTRRMSCLETWVPEVECQGHEVIFFQGNSDELKYDKLNHLLSLPICGDYDYNPCKVDPPKSLMLERLVLAFDWALKNKEFDYIFRTDDGSYINSFIFEEMYKHIEGFDCITNGFLGGSGMFFSKNLCKKIVEKISTEGLLFNSSIEDRAICEVVESLDVRVKHIGLLCPQYVVGENLFTIHYTNGKRMYFTDYVIKRYFNEDRINARKIILNYLIDSYNNDYPNTWAYDNGITPRWYSYTTNHKNWEHYGQLIRSNYNIVCENNFGRSSIKELIIYKTVFNVTKEHEKICLLSYLDSLCTNGVLYFFFEKETEEIQQMLDFLRTQTLKIKQSRGDLKEIIDTNEIISEKGVLIQIKKYE